MTDRPIIFGAPMVLALIAGAKSQTRRMVKVEAERPVVDFVKVGTAKDTGRAIYEMKDKAGQHVAIAAGKNFITHHYSPPIAVGDRLWVKETWRTATEYDEAPPRDVPVGAPILHAAGTGLSFPNPWWGKARPSLFMPRWASRNTLIVDFVKVERLQSISDDDALAEGVEGAIPAGAGADIDIDGQYWPGGPRRMYARLWDMINGEGAWARNPWIVAYTFRRVPGNIDKIEGDA